MCPATQYIQIELGNNSAVGNWIEPFATDISGVTRTLRSHSPGTVFPVGVTTVQYQFMDGYGNNEACEFNISATVGKNFISSK